MILDAPFNINDIRLLIDFFFVESRIIFLPNLFFIINLKFFVCILKDVEIFFTLLK